MVGDARGAPGAGDSGRLDLDHLDELGAAVDLDVVGDDGPTLTDRVSGWLDDRGVPAFLRRHRAVVAAVTAVAVVVAAGGLWWWSTRPPSLPEPPRLVARASGVGPELAELAPDGQATQVQQSVEVTSAEARGIGVEVLGITGPGLGDVAGLPVLVTDLDRPDTTVPARGALACGTTAQTVTLSSAHDVDYRLVVRRTSREGATAMSSISLVGAQQLLDLVRSTCLQRTADRELRASVVSATPLAGSVALRVAFRLEAIGAGAWTSVQVSSAARPGLVAQGVPLTVSPGRPATAVGNLWVADCGSGASGIEQGVLLSATPPGDAPGGVDPPVVVPLDAASVRTLGTTIRSLCGAGKVTATVTAAFTRSGADNGTSGTLDLDITLSTPDTPWIELSDSTTGSGRLTAQDQVLMPSRGTARTEVRWQLPPCEALLDTGLPRLKVSLVTPDETGGVRRPYLVALDGEDLGIGLNRLCPDLASEIRAAG